MANKQSNKAGPKPTAQNKTTPKKRAETRKKFPADLKLALLLGLISLIVYANTLKNGYVLDDTLNIVKNQFVAKGFAGIPEIMSTPYHRGSFATSNDLYRPLSVATLAIEYQFWGNNPGISHFINILLFAGCVILLFFFFDRLFEHKRTALAFIASLLFALHPIHTEVVANIKSRDELLCFFFAFLSLNLFINYVQANKITQLLLGSFCFLLSLFSKETVITFLAVIPIIFYFYANERKRNSVYIFICSALMAVIFLAVRNSVLRFYDANNISNIQFIDNALAKPGLSFESRIATAILILGHYLRLLIIPYPLICDYSFNSIPFAHFSSPAVLISLAAYLFLAVYSIMRFLKDHKDPFAFGILFFLITISLFSNIPFLIGATMGERFLFFPSAGLCLVIALLIEKLAGKEVPAGIAILKRPVVAGAVGTLCIVYAIITIIRNSDWVDNYTLYSTDIKSAPDNSRLNYYLGSELEKIVAPDEKDPAKHQKIIEESIGYLKKSIAICPDFREAQSDLGAAYFRNSQFDSAEIHAKYALDLQPNNIASLNNLAAVYGTEKKYAQAIELYKNAIMVDPEKVLPYTNAGLSFINIGKYDSAIYYLKKAIIVNPGYNSSFEFLATAYSAAGALDSAKKYEAIAQKNNPKYKL